MSITDVDQVRGAEPTLVDDLRSSLLLLGAFLVPLLLVAFLSS